MIPQTELYGLENNNKFSSNAKTQLIKTQSGEKTLYYEKFIPRNNDALLEEINDFVRSVNLRSSPIVDGQAGLNALKIALEIENKIFLNE